MMKGNIRIVFFLCIGLLICVLIGQGGWLYKTRKMEINRFRQEAGDRLGNSFKEFLDEEWMTRKVPFSYGLKEDKKTFVYGDWKSHATLTLLATQDCPLWLQYD